MEVVLKIVQLVLSLSLLIFVHEMGHFFFARVFGMRVDKFYLFFNPSFSILRAKRIGGRWRLSWFSPAPPADWSEHPEKTEWGIGWLPFGGYCKIAGMIDESMDKEQLKQPPQSWEYRSRPAWQRIFVMVGGVLFNVIFAILIYWGMLFTWGEQYIANRDVAYGVHCDSLALEMGFRHGDRIVSFSGEPVERFMNIQPNDKIRADIQISLIRNRAEEASVVRDGDTLSFPIDAHYIRTLLGRRQFLFSPRYPFVVDSIAATSHNAQSGLLAGDRIVAIDSTPALWPDLRQTLLGYAGEAVGLTVERGDSLLVIAAAVNDEGQIGVYSRTIFEVLPVTTQRYNLLSALPVGVVKGYDGIVDYVKELRLIFSPDTEAYKSVGSFITIANVFPGEWNWYSFWEICGMLSIMLAVLNILPIPALDGGHLMFALYELISRRKASDKFVEVAQWIGFLFLIALMLLAFGNDIIRYVF
ncbi:MAG: RIP metalloprotease RseP [Prevotellaceae bacterium]|jgi:regulator of sigma E protease|nr:RIP metalloprotease RseP [Prevotellaceae bacterium]